MTGKGEPTSPELLAAAASIAIAGRKLITGTDRTSFRDVSETLDALHDHLAVAGGSLLTLAERLGCEAEVRKLIAEGQARVAAFRAFRGTEGRA
ncbi:hypothetical protein CG51_16675 [Haematobacter missouriensis]|uniref:Uncharacterized protein n=1 Tax=Haematobacter missouriensis TaxID=366616 RepID=A0A212AYC8_9RHOB|nr:hypothetical protein [Haematobacter missouriensis]KFI33204.1 hypothetical protein CG51_16675 [Haematobacter missouriensis]OWJ78649.1 hypothetical protein CDV53_03065 [Haematobacter missouriensis]OWJ86472.1 hypothetical protein CDV52_00470 [Haematobacter missouriensis]